MDIEKTIIIHRPAEAAINPRIYEHGTLFNI